MYGHLSLQLLRRASAYVALLSAGILFSIIVHAASTDGLELSADSISRDYETRTVILEGHVRIGMGADRLRCDKAVINMKKQEIVAEGNISLESAETYIEGEKIVYNYKTKLGEIHQGFVQAGQVVFLGEIIKKNSETNYIARDAQYTSCATCPPGWSFSGQEIEAEVGGYAYIKYPVLRIADFPVFILPRILVPLKSTRQSGILVPSLENSSSGGTAFTLPYFWAISRNKDLTYSLKTYEKRGLKHLAEYRYVLTEESRGHLNAAFLNDRAFTADGESRGAKEELHRGFLSYKHYYELPNNYIHRADLNLVSDLRYTRDFSEEIEGHGDPALENKTSITKNTESQHFSAEAAYYTNLLKSNTHDNNDDAVHRFPEVHYSVMETELLNSNLFFKFDFNYTNFARRGLSYDDVVGGVAQPLSDGTFDHSNDGDSTNDDLIRTGHRYIFQPSLSYPFHIGRYLDVNPSVTYNETQYRFNVEPPALLPNYSRNAESRYLQTDISFKTKYSAVYGVDDQKTNRYKHEIEPELIYSRIPISETPDHIFFGSFENQPYSRRNETVSNEDFRGSSRLQFDYRDRIFDKDFATFVLSNHLIRKSYSGGIPSYQKFLTFRLAQGYDFNVARQEDSRPWSNLNGLLDVRLDHFETHTTADYYPYAQVTNWSTRLKFISQMKNYLELTYSDNIIVQENQVDTNQRTETLGTGVGMKTKFLDLVGRANFSLTTHVLESWEYVALAKPPGDCWSIKLGHKKTTGSDTVFKLSLNFEFGGK